MAGKQDQNFAGPMQQKPLFYPKFQPKADFVLDQWKYKICNAPNTHNVMESFWQEFDNALYSVWKMHYNPYDDECKVFYKTSNLKSGMLQKLDALRPKAYGVLGVYGEEGNYSIDGLMFWKGIQIPQEWIDMPFYEYYTFKKLDLNDPATWEITEQYWLRRQEGDLVQGRPVVDVQRVV